MGFPETLLFYLTREGAAVITTDFTDGNSTSTRGAHPPTNWGRFLV